MGSYNNFVKTANEYIEKQPLSNRLLNEMNRITRYYNSGFEQMGLSVDEQGAINVNEDAFDKAMDVENAQETLEPLKGFANTILRKANQVSLNPMNYVHRTVVAYKNPGRNFVSPYVTSAYSGMMFNSYC